MEKSRKRRAAGAQGRPRSADADEAILKATLRQLATAGYARMSIEAVAEEAGTTKPTIYRRWPSKEELAVAALSHFQMADPPRPVGALREDLVATLRDFQAKLLRPNGVAMIGTVLAEEAHTPRLIEAFRRQIVGPRRAQLRSLLEAAGARGELRPGADLDAVVNLLIGSFYARYLTGAEIPWDWPERVVDTVLGGVAAT